MGENIVSIQECVDEITCNRQLRRLIVLPYELKLENVFPENIKFVTEFSKKTGDYPSLSATDIKLMALVYQLEKQHVGTEHLNTVPAHCKELTLDPPLRPSTELCGFHKGGQNESSKEDSRDDEQVDGEEVSNVEATETTQLSSDKEDVSEVSLITDFNELSVNDVLQHISEEEYESDEESDDDDDDDSDWITPDNVKQVKQEMDFGFSEDKEVTVACVTTDFAMQNVMKQIGLNVVGLDGRVIKYLRNYIFRCYACYKTTSNMTKVFCPNCGHKTLKKVAVSVDEHGQQKIHINPKKRLSTRGKRFSLPTPKGGKHANNPILCMDQPMPDQRPTRLARTKTNPMDDDYIAGFSPFATKDVYSRSAMLGIKGKNQSFKYWMKRNPNEVVRHGRKKK